jgi:hypothetical protein
MVAKSSILVFYLELTNKRKVFYWANQVLLFVVVVAGLGLSIHQVRLLMMVPTESPFDTISNP